METRIQPQDQSDLNRSRTLFTVITVCRNSGKTISRAFDSVIAQTYEKFEYILIDGASTDRTLDVVAGYKEKFACRNINFRWISEPDDGIYDAMNKGIALANGDLIGILNSDDFYEPRALEIVAGEAAKRPECGVFYGFLRVWKADRELLIYRYRYENYLLDLSTGIYSAAQHPTCFVRAEVYRRVGGYDTQFFIAADHDFLIRSMLAGVVFHPIGEVLSNFTSGGASDRMSDYQRHRQRYAIFFKNGLISKSEFDSKGRELRYKKYKELKQKLARLVFRV